MSDSVRGRRKRSQGRSICSGSPRRENKNRRPKTSSKGRHVSMVEGDKEEDEDKEVGLVKVEVETEVEKDVEGS